MERWGARTEVDRDEGELVRRCLAGDQDACADLVQGYARMVGTVIWRATGDDGVVEDLAQETFLRVFRGLPYFDARAKLSTWIYTIAHRVVIDHLRKLGRPPEEPDGLLRDPLPASGVIDPEAAATSEEIDRFVRDGLAELPEKYRLPLVYAAIDGLDYETIGTMLGVPSGTVKTLVFRGKRLLKDRIVSMLAAPTPGNEVSDAL
jgi:RNA polymerase sigma-70 factor (ECF subfamily)